MADLIRRPAMFSYVDGDEYIFMDKEDYTPYHLNKESIENEALFINEDTDGIQVVIVSEVPVALDLPMSVELEVVETDPSIKGASATSRTKPATLSTYRCLNTSALANGLRLILKSVSSKAEQISTKPPIHQLSPPLPVRSY